MSSVFRREGGRSGLRVLVLCIAAAIVFAGASAAWWLPVVRQTLLLSARSESQEVGFAALGSATRDDFLRLIWPYSGVPVPQPFTSDASNQFFWETASYPGVVTLGLALVCLIALGNESIVLFLACLAFAAAVLSLGEPSPIFRLASHIIPGLGFFRAWGRIFFILNLPLALLAGLYLSKPPSEKTRWTAPLMLAVLSQAVLFGAFFLARTSLAPARGLWTPVLVFFPLTLGCFLWTLRDLPHRVWQWLCLFLLVVDLFVYWGPNLQPVEVDQAIPVCSDAKFLAEKRSQEEFRVLDTTGLLQQDIAAREGLEMVAGYDPGIYTRTLELYQQIWRQDDSSIVELRTHSARDIACPVILDLMNVGYVVAYEADLGQDYELAYRTPDRESRKPRHVYRRKSTLPRAWLVPRAVIPPAGATVLDSLCTVNPREVCLTEDRPIEGSEPFRELAIERRSPSDLRLEFDTSASGMMVLSQAWHPDWRATDNGTPVEVRRVNHNFVGIPLGPGEHRIRVWYFPWDFYLGCPISAAVWIVVVAGGLRGVRTRLPQAAETKAA